MNLTTLVITLLVIAGFVTGISGFYGAMTTEYGMTTSKDFSTLNASSDYFNRTQSMTNNMYGIVAASQNKSSGSGILSIAPLNLLYGAYDAFMLVLQTPGYFIAIISDIGSIAGIPAWVMTLATAIVLVIILGAIISFITGRSA
jgi:hypothetical protein